MRSRSDRDRGSVTAEFAVAMPAVVLVLVAALAAMQVATQQLRLQDAASVATRTLARGDQGAASRAATAAPGSRIEVFVQDGLTCVTATARGRGLPLLGAISLSARSCALGSPG